MDTTIYLSKMAAGKPIAVKSAMATSTYQLTKQVQPWVRSTKSCSWIVFWLLAIFVWSEMVGKASALDVAFCTEQNTGASYKNKLSDIFQSHGLCADECRADYAFAIVQGTECWCSNYAPDKSAGVKVSNCDSPCPGYDKERCGNTIQGLFGYIRMGKAPTGTKTLSTSSTFTSTKTKTSSSSSKTTPSKTSSAIIRTVTTSDGRVTTITAVPTSNQSVLPSSPSAQENSKSFFSDTGKVIGLFVGLAVLIGLMILGLLFFLHKRKQKRGQHLTGGNTTPEPGMIGASAGKGLFGPGASEKNGGTAFPGPVGRTSVVIDQRLEPDVLHSTRMESDSASRLSVRSLRDDTDYSRRVLRVTNVD